MSCGARYGDVTCDRAPGHSGIHCGTASAKWADGDAPDPDPRDAEYETGVRLRAILRDVAAIDPLREGFGVMECWFCGSTAKRSVVHDSSCAWRRAREEAGR